MSLGDWLRALLTLVRGATSEQITAFGTLVMAVAALVAVVVAVWQIAVSKRLSKVQHLLKFLDTHTQEPMIQYRKRAATKYLKGDPDSVEIWELLNFFETIGLLLKRRYLDRDDVWEMMSYYVFPLYWTTKESVARVSNDDCNTLSNFEYLYECLAKAEKKHHGISPEPTAEEIHEFWEGEQEIVPGTPAKRRRSRSKKIEFSSIERAKAALGAGGTSTKTKI